MRRIVLPLIDWASVVGRCAVVPVKVDWPELQLTEEQVLANAVALANDEPTPVPGPVVDRRRGSVPEA